MFYHTEKIGKRLTLTQNFSHDTLLTYRWFDDDMLTVLMTVEAWIDTNDNGSVWLYPLALTTGDAKKDAAVLRRVLRHLDRRTNKIFCRCPIDDSTTRAACLANGFRNDEQGIAKNVLCRKAPH